ncbi:Hypothetical predicted protein, partial [Paramuricea clavata]
MAKIRGTQCCVFGCAKRKKIGENKGESRSDSEGSDDEESVVKRKFPRSFYRAASNPNTFIFKTPHLHLENLGPPPHWGPLLNEYEKKLCMIHVGPYPGMGCAVNLPTDENKRKQWVEKIHRKDCCNALYNDLLVTITLLINKSEKMSKKQEVETKNVKIEKLQRKLKSSQQKSRRLKRKVTSLKKIVKSLRDHHLISTKSFNALKNICKRCIGVHGDGLSGVERANLVKVCIQRLHHLMVERLNGSIWSSLKCFNIQKGSDSKSTCKRLQVTTSSGQAMHTTRRKTGFIGFFVAIRSTKDIFHTLVEAKDAPLKYLLTY